ncbi:MAG: hypothetical protein GX591_10385 [Planctomycetes bacterium]|nr:hypothetical protein [Planctomycetota bacterium]
MKGSSSASSNVNVVLDRIAHLLDLGRAEEALGALDAAGQGGPAVRNARGVILLRLGRPEAAVDVLRDLVLPPGTFAISGDTPVVFCINYVLAFLLAGRIGTGVELLKMIPEQTHPAVRRLADEVRVWRRALPWWRRLLLPLGAAPARPFRPADAPGTLWYPAGKENR